MIDRPNTAMTSIQPPAPPPRMPTLTSRMTDPPSLFLLSQRCFIVLGYYCRINYMFRYVPGGISMADVRLFQEIYVAVL